MRRRYGHLRRHRTQLTASGQPISSAKVRHGGALSGLARLFVGLGEVVPRDQGERRGPGRAPVRRRRGSARTAGSPRRPGPPPGRRAARLFRDVRVSGWSGPSTRSRSARVCSCSGIASAARPAVPVGVGEVVPRGQGVGVVLAEHPLPVGQGLLVQRDRLGGPARRLVGVGEVVPRGQGVGVVWAEHPLPVGQGLLVQRDRLGGPARVPVGGGEVVPRGQGVGVVRAEHPLAGRPGSARTAGSPRRPGPPPGRRRRGCSARSGCWGGPGPSTRSRSARVCSNSGIASAARPAAW